MRNYQSLPSAIQGPSAYTLESSSHVLRCPQCSYDYTHIERVFTLLGSDPQEAAVYEGTKALGKTRSRRSALVIVLNGECGHRWSLILQQHKGNIFVETAVQPTFPLRGDDQITDEAQDFCAVGEGR